MHKIIFLSFIVFVCTAAKSQSTYDSLKQAFSARKIFEQRDKGTPQYYVNTEINKIKNPVTRQLATCAVVENLMGYGWVDEKKLLAMIDGVLEAPATDAINALALRVKAEATRTLVNTKIPDIKLPSISGDSIRLADQLPQHEFTVVDLWATWCGPCIAEMKKFNSLRKQYPSIEFYSISLDEDAGRLKKFLDRNKDYTWPIVWAGEASAVQAYFKARLIPAFVIVDQTGTIVSHIVGKGLEDELKKLYKK